MPRDPDRIPRVLSALERAWEIDPDMRFGQLLIVMGVAKDDLTTWHREEQDTLKLIEHWSEPRIAEKEKRDTSVGKTPEVARFIDKKTLSDLFR